MYLTLSWIDFLLFHGTTSRTTLASLLSEQGDVWRERHADVRCYSCHSASHGGLFRIDLGNAASFPHVVDSAYEPRLLSDHSPFWVRLAIVDSTTHPLWRVNPFWLTFIPESDVIPKALSEFIQLNKNSASAAIVWDSLKAFLRDLIIREITNLAGEENIPLRE